MSDGYSSQHLNHLNIPYTCMLKIEIHEVGNTDETNCHF